MRRRTSTERAIDRTVGALVSMLEAGQETVRIDKVITMLGFELKVVPPENTDPIGVSPDPRVDPITGCLPVTASQPGVPQ